MRGKKAPKRKIAADKKYANITIAKLINYIMKDGKKLVAESIVYDAIDIVSQKTKQDGLLMFTQAMKNIQPSVEVKGRRVGGANYQVPVVVSQERKNMLTFRWLIDASRAKKGKRMAEKLADEIILATNNEGDAIKKKMNIHKMAEANKAFAHFG
jgi:small subunit ribosomal protein S7